MNRDKIIIFVIAVLYGIIVFSFTKMFSKKEIIFQKPEYSKYEKKIDSLKFLYKRSQDTINVLYKHIETLKLSRNENHKNTTNEIKKIKTFTSDSRKRYMDSVYRADSK